ncbi:hypothetical protein [Rhizobium sp. PP-CC-3G-465]|uniref:hypothetical protein n=1 Tax=Rhizobium sp. PP-CC-3G-465 TaxID=2135648 RepID=UPI001048E0BE|nr:hypothetical protein C8J33_11450 [Rhizobium sp. PP-CC-3G-465]
MPTTRKRAPFQRNAVKRADQRFTFLYLKKIKNKDVRNLIRGILSAEKNTELSSTNMNLLRRAATGKDLSVATEMLIGHQGAFPFKGKSETYRSLLQIHSLEEIPVENEVAFVIGHLNGWASEVKEIVGAIRLLSAITDAAGDDALTALEVIAERWGASNFLAKKIAYIAARDADDANISPHLNRIADKLNQQKYSIPFFSALEAIDLDFPLFNGMAGRVQLIKKHIRDDFRQLLPLSNIVAVPISTNDVGSFLRKSYSMSMVDEVVSIMIIMNLSEQWPSVIGSIQQTASKEIIEIFKRFEETEFNSTTLYVDAKPDEADLVFYRRSIAFLEFPGPASYRSFIDRVLGPRFLMRTEAIEPYTADINIPTRKDLSKALLGFKKPTDYNNIQTGGKFLRTVYFLVALKKSREMRALDQHDIRFIFEHTTGLDVLMSEMELERLYATADEGSRPLITVLALALHKSRSNSDDVDFKFRLNLSRTINEKYNKSIQSFFEWLLPNSPEVANFLLAILDRSTLQKMYWLVSSPDQADIIRQDILRKVGKNRGRIEYFIEADSIEARRQVSKLQQYFDDSRMYVDGFAMKRWLTENPTAYTQQYLRIIESGGDALTAVRVTNPNSGHVAEILVLASFDYVLFEIVKSAFHQFCTNTNFGIESYLGRRIRHNTLTGMMRGGVESIISKSQFQLLAYDKEFMASYRQWQSSYRDLIEDMRRDILQFRVQNKPKGIFKSDLNFDDDQTRNNLVALRKMIQNTKSIDLFDDLLMRFCWVEIDPQLKSAAKYIGVELLNKAIASMDHWLGQYDNLTQRELRHELRNAVYERFTRLASWFRQPESGFVSANTEQLCNLILFEASDKPLTEDPLIVYEGEYSKTMMEGLSVHRMYDCLSVLIRNALKYGAENVPVRVAVEGIVRQGSNLARFNVSVKSTLADTDERNAHVLRLEKSFKDDDLGASMVREGYTGIKKVRYITQTSESRSTVDYHIDGSECRISYVLTVEISQSTEADTE